MKLTAKQKVELRKWSTAMSGHNNDGSWFCPHCREWVEGRHVTFTELHEFCGFPVDKEIESNQPRAKARGFVGDALGYAISLLSRFAGRPRAAIPPRAEPSDSHGLTDSSRS